MTPRPPFLLYVITDLEVGGVPLHLLRLAQRMRDRGIRVAVVSLAPTGPVASMLADSGIDVHSCGGCCGLDFRVIARLGEIVAERNPDLVHSLLFHANLAARLSSVLNGFPASRLIGEIQTVEVERPWHLWVDRLTHRLSRCTVGNSPSVIEHLHKRAHIPLDRLQLVRGGVELDRIDSAPPADRSSLGLSPQESVILWIGRLDPVKGLDHLIASFAFVPSETRAHLLVAGGGPLHDHLRNLIQSLRLESRVHLLGPRSDVPSLLKAADVFAFPSRTEGLPNALLEAMAAACPIVTSDVPGCRDLITHGRTGLTVPYGDTISLARALNLLLSDRGLARRLGEAARNEVAKHWQSQFTWDAYEALYRQLLKR